jgi:hypothetical protein
MRKFSTSNEKLWQTCLARYDNCGLSLLDKYEQAIAAFLNYDGKLYGIKPEPVDAENAPVTATLLTISQSHNWRQYLGAEPIQLTGSEPTKLDLPALLTLKPQDLFGVVATPYNYNVLIPNAQATQINVPRLSGYALMAMSRELSRREVHYTETVY